MTFRRFFAGCVIVLIGMLVPTWPAVARQEAARPQWDFPPPIGSEAVRALNPTPEQTSLVRSSAERLGAILEQAPAGDGAFKKAREAVLRPLQDAQATAAFRNEYSGALMPALERLAAPGKPDADIKAINALRIAGSLATPGAVDFLERNKADTRTAVRYAVASGMARVFDALREGNPAIPADRAGAIVRTLRERLLAETDPLTLDACVRALIAAMETAQKQPFGDLLPAAYSALAQALGERLSKVQAGPGMEAELSAILRAGVALRNGFLKGGGLPIGNARMVEAAEFDGRILAFLSRQLGVAFSPGAARDLPAQMATVAETTILLANQNLGGGQQASRSLGDLIKQGKDKEFVAEAQRYIGAEGVLAKPPFGIDPNAFK